MLRLRARTGLARGRRFHPKAVYDLLDLTGLNSIRSGLFTLTGLEAVFKPNPYVAAARYCLSGNAERVRARNRSAVFPAEQLVGGALHLQKIFGGQPGPAHVEIPAPLRMTGRRVASGALWRCVQFRLNAERPRKRNSCRPMRGMTCSIALVYMKNFKYVSVIYDFSLEEIVSATLPVIVWSLWRLPNDLRDLERERCPSKLLAQTLLGPCCGMDQIFKVPAQRTSTIDARGSFLPKDRANHSAACRRGAMVAMDVSVLSDAATSLFRTRANIGGVK